MGTDTLGGLATADGLDRPERLAGLRSGEIGLVHSWELVTAVDGPGTRMTTFLAGCPLRCLYCHNPDTMSARSGTPVAAADLLARIRRYRGVIRATGGGITLSGGEVLRQPAFASRILRGAREMGIHTAIDTSGFLGARTTDAFLADVDLVLLDVKSGDPETYRRVTGRELAPTLAFGRRLADLGIETWIRFVQVPGVTDVDANITPIVDYAASLPTVSRVEVLPFHQMGRDKWAQAGLRYELGDVEPPTPERTEEVRAMFRAAGLTTY
ncbi:pyruvate formate-lyase-activating protein [Litorihabitans aurantiacus]|uniref:Pyruvate formate-lyase-activating enzyme n=1 Tax=Litorihabitans aurantiacus TaxID=1930061 RepID=A0AA37XGR3_9MICO|nr:pyruvate formate-lyase-activating protein [Litorihabitans aurantiacus]GMA32868.1 pyruvate formate-lyase-activating enzyme [Litorihabitans aurantiacus]